MNHETLMQIAYLVAQESKCVSWKVGAVIVKDGRIISTGVNGTPKGAKNCCEHAEQQGWLEPKYNHAPPHVNKRVLKTDCRPNHSEWSKVNEIHAELNAILFAAREGRSIEAATMYTTLSPCADCAKAIANSGITRLVYSEKYDRAAPDGLQILKSQGIEVICIDKSNLNFLDWFEITSFGGSNGK